METPPTKNRERLEKAGLITAGYEFPESDEKLIESLTEAEVEALVGVATKLGRDFLEKHGGGPTVGILF
jgi:hypothetical protein